jgi:hypothetical protein
VRLLLRRLTVDRRAQGENRLDDSSASSLRRTLAVSGRLLRGLRVQFPSGHPSGATITPDDDRSVIELVLSDGVTSRQAQCFIDLTTFREDLTYSTAQPNLYGLPPPECVARDQHCSRPVSLFQRPRRSTTAPVLNCRTSATSWSKLDRDRRSYANPNGTDDEPFPLVPRDLRDARDPPPAPPRSPRLAARERPDGTDNQP